MPGPSIFPKATYGADIHVDSCHLTDCLSPALPELAPPRCGPPLHMEQGTWGFDLLHFHLATGGAKVSKKPHLSLSLCEVSVHLFRPEELWPGGLVAVFLVDVRFGCLKMRVCFLEVAPFWLTIIFGIHPNATWMLWVAPLFDHGYAATNPSFSTCNHCYDPVKLRSHASRRASSSTSPLWLNQGCSEAPTF